MRPDQCLMFSDADIAFAERLLRKDLKEPYSISIDLERPTFKENQPPKVRVSKAHLFKKFFHHFH